ncbi:MAG TPA: endolytic transglycosylase MltG [Candidatus Dormibacteraeota bacterium]|nr:endolytic transglycosylase MltG [Candidatus Dormibacteraeota bacterium]
MARAFALACLALLLAGGGGTWWAWRTLHTPMAPATPGIVVVVPSGENFRAVADRLQAAGVIAHPLLLRAYARLAGLDRSVRCGEFRFAEPISPVAVLALLQSSSDAARQVTIPEGFTAEQVAAAFEERGYGGRDAFRCAMEDPALLLELRLPASGVEGFLFPDTYAFDPSAPPADIVRAMVGRFRAQTADLAERREAMGLSEAAMVTLASVIEKETGQADERPLISGVFHNRLRLGMLLQSDPTVLYGRRNGRAPLTRADLVDAQPYNTYVHRGLPPGPIANPGRAALEAAVTPARTTALYFVSRNDGSHAFSETLDEHNRAVRHFQPNRD